MRRLALVLLLVACGDNEAPPTCAEVGCPDTMPIICSRDGRCTCPQNPGEPGEICTREPKGLP